MSASIQWPISIFRFDPCLSLMDVLDCLWTSSSTQQHRWIFKIHHTTNRWLTTENKPSCSSAGLNLSHPQPSCRRGAFVMQIYHVFTDCKHSYSMCVAATITTTLLVVELKKKKCNQIGWGWCWYRLKRWALGTLRNATETVEPQFQFSQWARETL